MEEAIGSPSSDTPADPPTPPSLPKKRHPTAPPSKARRALRPLTSLHLCLTFLGIVFTFLALGFKSLHISTSTALDRATWDYEAAHGIAVREDQTRNRLYELTGAKLTKHFWETSYEECLARGLNTADVHFLGRDYAEFEYVRNRTMMWVKMNCDRIFFTPEVVKPKAVSKMATWHRRLREHSAKVVGMVKNWLAQVPYWKTGWKRKINSTTVKHVAAPASVPRHIYLPSGFRLVGCDTPPCQLAYTAPGNSTTTKRPIEVLDAAYEKKLALKRAEATTSKIATAVVAIWTAIGRVEILLLLIFAALEIELYGWPGWEDDSLVPTRFVRRWVGFPRAAAFAYIHSVVRNYIIMERPFAPGVFGRYLTMELPLALGIIGLLSFLIPNKTIPNIRLFIEAMEKLAAIADSTTEADAKEIWSLERRAPVPPSAVPRISPDTTLKEDIDGTLEALRAGFFAEWPLWESPALKEDLTVEVEAHYADTLDESPGGEGDWEDFSPIAADTGRDESTDEASDGTGAAGSHSSSASESLTSEWDVVEDEQSA